MRRVVCLLPVRNGERDLPECLSSATRFCDAIVALDDGSTDATRAILEEHALVRVVLSNPPRESFSGWNDAENRKRLLAAAAELHPAWILSVDADERLEADDAEAFRAFIDTDAVPGLAYGFRHVRMWGSEECDPKVTWVYRLFAFEPGQRFPDQRLHFDPVPTSIPRKAFVRTSIRLRHLAAAGVGRMRERAAKYREADPAHEYRTDFAGLDGVPETVIPWSPRDPWEPIILGSEEREPAAQALLPAPPDVGDEPADRPLLVCLLTVRNGEGDLRGYLESTRRFADAIVALDDGSTDGTRALLENDSLVEVLLRREERPDYQGWDDALNRRMLLQAAGRLRPEWVISLDADERIDAEDALALRRFVETEADRDRAYGFRVYRMIGENSAAYDRSDLVVGRLFAFEPGQEFPLERLHFVPIPTSIPQERWVPTTIRIQHLAGATEERRRARFEKYRQADPANEFQTSYTHLLDEPGTLMPWEPRPADLPVVQNGHAPFEGSGDEELSLDDLALMEVEMVGDLDAPVLSAIVIARDDEERIEEVVRAVVDQVSDEAFEVIVVTSGTDRTAEIVRVRFPDVTLVELGHPALPGEARNAGLAVARGDYVSFPGSHVVLPPGSLDARIKAHELGYPMVTGTTLNGNETRAGWASYFLDHSTTLPGRPSGELTTPPPHCSYDRQFLVEAGGFPEDMRAGEDTAVNLRLVRRGFRPYRAKDVTLLHISPCSNLRTLLRHHFQRGRALGRIMLETRAPGTAVLNRAALRRTVVGYLPIRIAATSANVRAWGVELRSRYRRVLPFVVAGAASAWGGTLFELFRPVRGKLGKLLGEPGRNLVLAGLDRRDGFPVGRADVLLLARVSLLSAKATVVALPRDLLVEIPGHGPDLLNAAYYLGARRTEAEDLRDGLGLLSRTLEGSLGIPIHGEIVVDFDGFRRVVDALGGVPVDVSHDIHDEFLRGDGRLFSAHFRAGRQLLDGERALTYVRTRRSDGDTWRRRRHVDVAIAIVERARRVRSPARALALGRAARSSVRTTLRPLALAALAQAVARLRPTRVRTTVIKPPLVRSERMADGRWVHTGDAESLASYVRASLLQVEDPSAKAPKLLRSP